MKTKKELDALKNEVKNLKNKLADLNEEELAQVTGGIDPYGPAPEPYVPYNPSTPTDPIDPPCNLEYRSQKPPAGSCTVAIDIPACAACPSNPNYRPYGPNEPSPNYPVDPTNSYSGQ